MFVSILRQKPNKTEIVECGMVDIQQPTDDPERIFVKMTGVPHRPVPLIYDLQKKEVEVYIMGADGKTIDSYRW